MMDDAVIKVENLTKIYKLYDKISDRIKEAVNPFHKSYHRDFYALKDVSFEIKRGETVGVIGTNGSGKSTLLKILTGVLTPSSGKVMVNGNVSALLELGSGFSPELSGFDNVYFSGILMGFSKREMDDKMDEILAFADIGDYIKQPVKSYSSGMYVRLAFSVATCIDPDILIVDEALSVGDMFFQAKCMSRMKKMIDNDGTTLFFVSHDIGSIKSLCKKSIFLSHGNMISFDLSENVSKLYFRESISLVGSDNIVPQSSTSEKQVECDLDNFNSEKYNEDKYFRAGNGKARITNVEIYDFKTNLKLENQLHFNQKVKIKIYVKINEDVSNISIGYHIRDNKAQSVLGNDTFSINRDSYFTEYKSNDRLEITFSLTLPLIHGDYSLCVLISKFSDFHTFSDAVFLDWIENVFVFKMMFKEPVISFDLVHLPNELEIKHVGGSL